MIVEWFYINRNPRIYKEYAPAIRSERSGLEVIEEEPISTNGTKISGTIRATYYKNGERNIEENIKHGLGYEGVIEPQVLTTKRTKYGKQIRKDYENHNIQESRHNMTKLEPRNDGIAQTITSVQKDNLLLEPIIVASRGRNPTKPSDRTTGCPTEQRLEPNTTGCSNTITTVEKDNYILEPEYVGIKQATKKGFIECEVGGVCDLSYPTSKKRRGRVQGGEQISPTITGNIGICKIEKGNNDMKYRIRKLTPRETWRLMDYKDEDFDKATKVNSSTQLYKEAGNGIVRNCLVAIFGQMFSGKENVYTMV